jgi:hypothetical protein
VTFSVDTEVLAIVLTVVVHIIGATALIWGMIDFDDPDRGSWRDWWPRDDRGDDGPPPGPGPEPQGGGLPVPVLSDSRPPAVRGDRARPPRIGDLTPRPARRGPAHPPAPVPAERTPARDGR